jgi:hypothetical protein
VGGAQGPTKVRRERMGQEACGYAEEAGTERL